MIHLQFPNSNSKVCAVSSFDQLILYIGRQWYDTLIFTSRRNLDYFLICEGRILETDPLECATVWIIPRLPGGKGGFGSKLKSQGRKKIQVSNSSCRDLNGNRLSAIQKNQDLALYLKREQDVEKEKEKEINDKIAKGLRGFQPQKVQLDDTRLNNDTEESFEIISEAVQKAFSNKALDKAEKGKSKIEWDQAVDEYKSSSDEE